MILALVVTSLLISLRAHCSLQKNRPILAFFFPAFLRTTVIDKPVPAFFENTSIGNPIIAAQN